MSFSSHVKEELSRQVSPARHCQIAETAAILSLCGKVHITEDNQYMIRIHTENVAVARKYFTLLKKAFNIRADVAIRRNAFLKKNRTYTVAVRRSRDAVRVLQAARLLGDDGDVCENMSVVKNLIIQNSCCRRAFVRGAFLAAGSLSDPEKFYHFEIVCSSEEKAEQLREIIGTFSIEAKIVVRKKYYVVYQDIAYIRDTVGLDYLPESLAEIAQARLERPDATLKELGEILSPPVGKSGVNHRLRKISSIAESLRGQKSQQQELFLERNEEESYEK